MANRNLFRRLGLADEVAAPSLAKLRQPRTLRRMLLAAGPVLVLAGALFVYTTGGRYISTDDAYVHAGKLTVATDVSGIVSNVAVHESQKVEKGEVLFTLDQEPFQIALAGAQANLGTVRNQLTTLQATYRQKQAQIEQAKTDVAFYETTFQRQQDLLKRGVASQAAYDQARRDLDSAREHVTMAQHDAQATLAPMRPSRRTPTISPPRPRSTRPSVTCGAPPCWRRSRAS
jgi:membrane fusion protein (multidrug efflux system)